MVSIQKTFSSPFKLIFDLIQVSLNRMSLRHIFVTMSSIREGQEIQEQEGEETIISCVLIFYEEGKGGDKIIRK